MTDDPLESAMSAEYNPTRSYFGQTTIDCWHCVLVKGQGKIPFDSGQHKQEQRCTAIDITISPLPGSKANFDLKRELIAESKEWAQIIKPSLVALGVDLRSLNNRYVQVERVPTGQKYTNKAGEEKESLTIKFTAVYPDFETCQAAADAFFGSRSSTASGSSEPSASDTGQSAEVTSSPKEKETAAKFLPALFKASGGDINKFAQSIANNPLVSRYFDLSSPEVIALVQAA